MPHGIFPPELARLHVEHAGQKYLPSNGTEGDIFIASWCGECQRNRSARDGILFEAVDPEKEICMVLSSSFAGEADEWQIGPDGQPRCVAFVSAGQPVAASRCQHTMELDL
jgi:hypothetical protein